MPRMPSAAISCTFLILYSIVCGGATSARRSVIMFVLCVTAENIGRSYDILSTLTLSMIIILLSDPLLSRDEVGELNAFKCKLPLYGGGSISKVNDNSSDLEMIHIEERGKNEVKKRVMCKSYFEMMLKDIAEYSLFKLNYFLDEFGKEL